MPVECSLVCRVGRGEGCENNTDRVVKIENPNCALILCEKVEENELEAEQREMSTSPGNHQQHPHGESSTKSKLIRRASDIGAEICGLNFQSDSN